MENPEVTHVQMDTGCVNYCGHVPGKRLGSSLDSAGKVSG